MEANRERVISKLGGPTGPSHSRAPHVTHERTYWRIGDGRVMTRIDADFRVSSMRAALLIVAALGAMACDPYGVYYINTSVPGYDDVGFGFIPLGFQLGDTVTFEAAEQYAEGTHGSPAAPSSVAPRKYKWASSNAGVAEVIAPGRVVMRGTGKAVLTVSTGHASDVVVFSVVPRITGVRISPKEVSAAVGDTFALTVTAVDANGAAIPGIDRPSDLVRLLQPDIRDNYVNPIAANIATLDMSRFTYGTWRPGEVIVIGALPIFGAHRLRDTARIVVRPPA